MTCITIVTIVNLNNNDMIRYSSQNYSGQSLPIPRVGELFTFDKPAAIVPLGATLCVKWVRWHVNTNTNNTKGVETNVVCGVG